MINRVSAFAGNQHPVHFARKVQNTQPVFGAAARATKAEPVPVTVTGRGFAERMPDTMDVSITLQEMKPTRKEVNEALNVNSAKLMQAIEALKLPAGVRVSSTMGPVNALRQYDHRTQESKITGYQGSFYVNVTEQSDKPEEFGDHAAALKNVADQFEESGGTFSGPTYSVKKDGDARLEALEKAVEDARTKAQRVVAKLGLQLDERPLSVEIGAVQSPSYQPRGGMRMAAASLESMDDGAGGGASQASGDSFKARPIAIGSDRIQISFSIKA